jgi:hypothetical protein
MNPTTRHSITKTLQPVLPLRSIGWRGEGRGEVSRSTIFTVHGKVPEATVLRSREREKVPGGRLRVVGEKTILVVRGGRWDSALNNKRAFVSAHRSICRLSAIPSPQRRLSGWSDFGFLSDFGHRLSDFPVPI